MVTIVNRWVAALRLTGIGFYIGGCIFLGVFLGLWIDRKFDFTPLFTFMGLGLGLLAAFYGTYRMLIPVLRRGKDKDVGDE
jgi:F0F1-type ATP synthase assembly protein I